jgi:hypothetical protein
MGSDQKSWSLDGERPMPPSGFNQKAVDGVVTFVESCFEDLQLEVDAGKHTGFNVAVVYEVRQITSAMPSLPSNDSIRGALALTRSSYEGVERRLAAGAAPDVAVHEELADLRARLLRLHINEKGQIADRDP